jgi:hypothetical protein
MSMAVFGRRMYPFPETDERDVRLDRLKRVGKDVKNGATFGITALSLTVFVIANKIPTLSIK